MTKVQKLTTIFLFSIFYFLISGSAWAAVLYLEPAEGEYYQGDTFLVQARIDVKDECINTIEANLTFPQDILEAVDFSQGDSILTLWVNPPSINQESGVISFTGGIPGGYCGFLPGDPGESNLLGKIIFKVKEVVGEQFSDTATVGFLDSSQILLNDGFGTLAGLETKGAVFDILTATVVAPKQEWQEELAKDNIPPEPFKVEINQEPSTFDGKYFITFSTTDKQTGIDYYEVGEGKKDWQKAASPYLLADQGLRSIIKVKAVDKAGNERIAEYRPPTEFPPYFIIILVLIAIGVVGYWLYRKSKIKY